MSFASLVRSLLRNQAHRPTRKHLPRRPRIRLDSLEDRTAPAVGTIQFASNTGDAFENESPSITVNMVTTPNPLTGTVSADITQTGGSATSGSDYNAFPTTTISFSNADPHTVNGVGDWVYSKSASLTLIDDQRVEAPETIVFNLGNVVLNGDGISPGSPVTHTFTINDNDSATASVSGTSTATEGGATALVPVTLTMNTTGSGTVGLDVSVGINLTGAGSGPTGDYTFPATPPSMAVFIPGDGTSFSQSVTVTAVNDTIVEGSEKFALTTVVDSSGGANVTTSGTNTLTVNDNDTATLSIATGTTIAAESGATGNVPVTLTITADGSGTPSLGYAVAADLTPGDGGIDFTTTSTTFAAGSTSGAVQDIVVTAVNDTIVEGMENIGGQTLNVAPSDVGVTVGGASGTQTIQITDNDTAAITFKTGTSSATEGGANASVDVTLTITGNGTVGTGTLGTDVKVDLTGPGAGVDYTLPSTVTFTAGSASGTQNVNIPAINDTIVEGAETFTLSFTNLVSPSPVGTVTTSGTNALTITDNDTAAITFTSPTSSATEGGADASVGVTLTITGNGVVGSGTLGSDVSVDLTGASAGTDYTLPTAPMVTFSTGSGGATQTVIIPAVNDTIVEGTESFNLSFTNLVAPSPAGTVTATGTNALSITDNDTAEITFATATSSATEGGADASIGVTLTITGNGIVGDGTLGSDVKVDLTGPSAGTDYTLPATPMVTFASGSGSGTQTVTVKAVNDTIVEAPETFTLSFTNLVAPSPTGTVTTSGTNELAITDNDFATVSISTGTTGATEGGPTGNVQVSLLITGNGVAGTGTLGVPVTVNLNPNATSDFTTAAATFAISSNNSTTASVVVTAIDDRSVEQTAEVFGGETLEVTNANGADVTVAGSSATRTINILDNDRGVVTFAGTANLTEGSATTPTVTATLSLNTTGSGPVSLETPISATLTSATSDFTATTVSWAAGEVSTTPSAKDIVLTVVDDQTVEQKVETLAATLSTTSAGLAEAAGSVTVNITDNESAKVSLTSPGTTSVTEGGSTANVGVTLTLTSPSGTGPLQLGVPVTATLPGNADYSAAGITFAAGAGSGATANIVVSAVDDAIVELPTESFASQALGISTTASFTPPTDSQTINITDNDTATVTINDVTVTEGDTVTFTVSLDKALDIPLTIDVSYGGDSSTATKGVDYDGTTDTATFSPGVTSQTVTVTTVNDTEHEPTETFLASLSTSTALGGRVVSTTDTAIGIIVDNDNGAPTVSNRSFTLAEDTTFSSTLTGSDPENDPLTFSVVNAPTHGVVVLNADGSFSYTPAGNYNGSDSFTYKANDTHQDSTTATVTLSITPVNDAPVANDGSGTTDEDTAFNGTLSATDVDSASLSFVKISNPAHGTVAINANGTFTYTPAGNFNGTDSFTFKANDGSLDSNTATFSITVNAVNDAPVATNGSGTTNEDTLLSGTLSASDVDNATLTFSKVSDPAHGTVTVNTDGTFTYTPNGNYNGSDSFTFKASDGSLDSNTATFSVTVNAVNDPPSAFDGSGTTDEDTALTGTLSASDVDGNSLIFSLVGAPAHGTVTVAVNGTYVYTPNANYNGSDTFSFKVNDGTADSNIAGIAITVNAVNDAPVATNGSGTTDEDTALSGTLSATDVDSATLTFSKVSNPAHGTVTVNTDGTFTYTPNGNYNGSDSFTFKASDGSLDSNTATFSITVNAVNDAPVASDGSGSTNEDTVLIGAVSATDVDGNALTYSKVSNPNHGTVTVSSNGTFVYTPNANFNGTDTFTFKANDGTADSNVATVTITVTSVNDAPVATNGSGTTDEDIALSGTLSATDVDNATLTFSKVSDPAHGTVTVNSDGTITYTPNGNYNGTDSFTFKASDGSLDSNTATFSITVNAVNDAPVASDGSDSTNEDTTLIGSVSATDVDGNALTYSKVSNPIHGTVTVSSNGTFVYTPNANYNGPDSFTFKASDGSLDSNTATFSITVNAVNDAPVATNGGTSMNEDASLSGTLSASDVDNATLTFSKVSDPVHGTVTVNSDGTFVYNPAANYNGPDSFTFKASDGSLDSNTATFSITVNPVNDAPVAAPGTASTNEDTVLIGAVSATDVDGNALTYSKVSNPANGTVTVNANGTFVYTPNANFNGTDSFTYKANDGAADSNTATVTITVNAVNDAPVATGNSGSTNEDTAFNGTLSATDVDNATFTFSKVSDPAHGTVTVNANGTFTYTPTTNYNGSDSFTFKASDGSLDSNVATITLTVVPVNDNPTVVNDSFIVGEDSGASSLNVLANDSSAPDGGETLTVISKTNPSHGTVSIPVGGQSVIYTPNPNYNGPDSFTYTVSDGNGGSATATVNVTVSSINDLPTAINDSATLVEDGGAQTINVLANDSFAPDTGETLTISSVTQGQHGTVAIAPGGLTLTYTPNPDYAGGDTFLYTISDGNGGTAIAAVVVDVTNDAADRLEVVTTPGITQFTETVPPPSVVVGVAVDAGIRIGSAVDGIITKATVKISAGYVTGKDKLTFTPIANNPVRATWNATTGTLTLKNAATPAQYQEALRTVMYLNKSQAPVDGIRTITFKVQDSAGVGTVSAKLLRVTGINTKPTVTIASTTVNYHHGAAAVAVAGNLTIKDVDNTRLQSATVRITGFVAGDVLSVVTKAGIVATYNDTTGILTLTGNATLANYQAVLRTLKFKTPSATGLRTIEITVNDGLLDSSAVTRNVNVT